MTKPERVAILEDNEQLAKELAQQLSTKGMFAVVFTSRREFGQSIKKGDRFDFVVLDWFFEGDTSVQARLVFEDLEGYRYVPVVVYTEEPDAALAEINGLKRPHSRTACFAKGELTPDGLAEQVSKWYEGSFNAQLSDAWRTVRSAAFEKSLYELDALESTDFHRTLQRLLMIESGQQPDIDHALDFLERYVSRKVIADSRLREVITTALVKEKLPEPQTRKEREEARRREPALINAHCYIPAFDKVARTGDVIELTHPKGSFIGVVLTPACDLENGKSEALRVVEAEPSDGAAERDSEWQLTAVKVDRLAFRNFILNFHQTFFVTDLSKKEVTEAAAKSRELAASAVKEVETKEKDSRERGAREALAVERDARLKEAKTMEAKEREVRQRLITYEDKFQDRFGTELKLRCICRLDDPYRSDLLQRFSSHASRVGIP